MLRPHPTLLTWLNCIDNRLVFIKYHILYTLFIHISKVKAQFFGEYLGWLWPFCRVNYFWFSIKFSDNILTTPSQQQLGTLLLTTRPRLDSICKQRFSFWEEIQDSHKSILQNRNSKTRVHLRFIFSRIWIFSKNRTQIFYDTIKWVQW